LIPLVAQNTVKLLSKGARINRLRWVAIKLRIQDLFPIALHGIGSERHYWH